MANKNHRKVYNLWVHDQQFSKDELVINPDCFANAKVGDILEILYPTTNLIDINNLPENDVPLSGLNGFKRLCLAIKALAPQKNQKGALQLSISKYIASVFDFSARRDVFAHIIPQSQAAADFVELSFKEQYIGRSDMWRLKLELQNTCVYVLKKLSFSCIRAQVEVMITRGQQVSSGLITENTKFVFRSRSARFFLLIQLSKEMWEFDDCGEIYFEKLIRKFLRPLFEKWKLLGTSHSLTIAFFRELITIPIPT
eukprot:TRINITY_DN17413_c0_g1_i1.p1 TRINITY_DN17413_c0_g1~~TRINITY_DN17413_c0_g1_i1.p1  ORF type:complete len:255 (-),score=21.56 TRINITY_DN17413_c0_g1_i1:63-827(-)